MPVPMRKFLASWRVPLLLNLAWGLTLIGGRGGPWPDAAGAHAAGIIAAGINAVLAAFCAGGVALGRPWTVAMTPRWVPDAVRTTPLFHGIHQGLSVLWAVVFALQAILAWAAPALGRAVALPVVALALGFSFVFPKVFTRWVLKRRLRRQNPYDWAPPSLPAPSAPGGGVDVVVVGAGIGGLTAAALLARRGLKVTVLEAHDRPGGYCSSWERRVTRDGRLLRYVFDAGVIDISGLGPTGPLTHLLRALGLEEALEWRRVSQELHVSGLALRVPHSATGYLALLIRHFPGQKEALERFFASMERIRADLYADAARTGGVPRRPGEVDALLRWPQAHPEAATWMERPFTAFLDAHGVSDPALRRILGALSGYLTDRADLLTVGKMAPLFGYVAEGGFYPAGGSQRLADVLVESIRAHGGAVRLKTRVARILAENGAVRGVVTEAGETLAAPAVVLNADPARAAAELFAPADLPAGFRNRVVGLAPSPSGIAVALGLDFVPDIAPATLWRGGRDGLAILAPSLVDPALAPPGHTALTLLGLVPAEEAAQWLRLRREDGPAYGRRKREAADRLIAAAEAVIPRLRDHIVYRQDASPATFARYAGTLGGGIYGPALGQDEIPAKWPLTGLVAAGSGVFPGAGIEAAVISGTLAADALCPVPAA